MKMVSVHIIIEIPPSAADLSLPGAYAMGFNDGFTVEVSRATRPPLS